LPCQSDVGTEHVLSAISENALQYDQRDDPRRDHAADADGHLRLKILKSQSQIGLRH
jgi:hypothetical protein